MQQALGWLRWSPDQFWGSTLAELTAAVAGYLETRGVDPQAGEKERAMQGDLLAMLEAEMEKEGAAAIR
jgi:hypothetical protein